jgi:hypothetical protein
MAYQMTAPRLEKTVAFRVRELLQDIREAKESWTFSARTQHNNHQTHQLKMLRLIDAALGESRAAPRRIRAEQAHLARNIDAQTGVSVDLEERDALYYHNYALEPWLEVAWSLHRLEPQVDAAVQYLASRIETGALDDEFTRSVSSLDAQRGASGFGYGKGGSVYDPARSRRVFWTWSALTGVSLSPELADALSGPVKTHELYYQARGELCKRG